MAESALRQLMPQEEEGDRYFKHGGSVERVAHNDNRKYL